MRLFPFLITCFVICINVSSAQSQVIKKGNSYYLADRIVVKYKNTEATLNKSSQEIFTKFSVEEIIQSFPNTNSLKKGSSELEKIYTLRFSSPFNTTYIIKEISKLTEIEWAEPYYLYQPTYVPNDSIYNSANLSQYQHLKVIKAEEAWDINKGSKDIIIAIVDTGVDWDHPDLRDNIWINEDEIVGNGIDDDNNGYIDDIRGWDFGGESGTPDNDPSEDQPDHGTHVAGLASATTDNLVGIASIGFNSKIMAIKTSRNNLRDENGSALISDGYKGIKYAVDNGAQIINCSWGGYSYSAFAQSVIEYTTTNGALVVAAAGNDNSSEAFFPSSYDGVLSVAATDHHDIRASWSNYGTKIDVSSPGVSIYSTWQTPSQYATLNGTSMASPIVAGLAALVTNQFPNYSPLQIGEQIRASTDNINSINLQFANKLGSGRINAHKSLINNEAKSARLKNRDIIEVGDNDGIYEAGESIKFNLAITNFLNPLSNLNISLSSLDNNIEFVKSSTTLGSFNTLESKSSGTDELEIKIKPDSEDDVDIDILVTFTDGNYTDYDWITISINPTYEIHKTENLSLTFNSKGSIGFDDYPTNLKGTGLIFNNGPNLVFEGALIYGTSANTIVNSARNEEGDKDEDFSVINPIVINTPGNIADLETYTKFSDVSASPSSLGIETEVITFSFAEEVDANSIFVRYIFNNTTNQKITNFYAGQYWDFDIDAGDSGDDKVGFDTDKNFAYFFDEGGDPVSTFVGITLLSNGNLGFSAMDNEGTTNPTIAWDGFSDLEKWTAITSGTQYLTGGPNDISALISSGIHTIEPNSNITIDFVVSAGKNLSELTTTITRARTKYSEILTDILEQERITNNFNLDQNYPNPFNPKTIINYSIPPNNPGNNFVKLAIYDMLGREIDQLVNQIQSSGKHSVNWNASNYSSGIYFYRLTYGKHVSTKQMVLLK